MPKRLDGFEIPQFELRFFRRSDGGNWYAEHYSQVDRASKIESMKTPDRDKAVAAGVSWRKDLQRLEWQGLSLFPVSVEAAYERFISVKRREHESKNLSASRFRNIRQAMDSYLLEFMGRRTELNLIPREHFFGYHDWRLKSNSNLSVETTSGELRVAHQFLTWCIENALLSAEKMPNIRYRRMDRSQRRRKNPFSPQYIRKFDAQLKRYIQETEIIGHPKGIRAARNLYYWFHINRHAGLRKGELTTLRWKDIRWDFEGTVIIELHHGKEGPRNVICLPDVKGYLFEMQGWTAFGADDHFLFVDQAGEPMLPADSTWDKQIKLAGLDEETIGFRLTPNVLRHTYATERLRKGVDIEILAQNLGTSRRYILENYVDANTIHHAPALIAGAETIVEAEKPKGKIILPIEKITDDLMHDN